MGASNNKKNEYFLWVAAGLLSVSTIACGVPDSASTDAMTASAMSGNQHSTSHDADLLDEASGHTGSTTTFPPTDGTASGTTARASTDRQSQGVHFDERQGSHPPDDISPQFMLGPDHLNHLTTYAVGVWRGDEISPEKSLVKALSSVGPVYLAIRKGGKRLWHGWGAKADAVASLRAVISEARRAGMHIDESSDNDTFEIVLTHNERVIDITDPMARRALTSNIYRGIRGFSIEFNGTIKRHAPTLQLAQNRALSKSLSLALQDFFGPSIHATDSDEYLRERQEQYEQIQDSGTVTIFDGEQVLLRSLNDEPASSHMFRGNRIVPMTAVNPAQTSRLAEGMIHWLDHHLDSRGRMTYVYYPSRGEEGPPTVNNMIRQWMATVALGKVAADRDDEIRWARAASNIEYNLSTFYHEEDELGLIEWNGKVKLGALGLACLAIFEHPQRARWHRQEVAMRRTIKALWDDDGSFTTFYRKPSGTREQPNFYPGEALLYLTAYYAEEKEPELLERLKAAFRYYRAWHLEPDHRNPAFVPWHIQAWYQLWKVLEPGSFRDQLVDFIFTMADWLLGMQQWETAVTRDALGRFYDPDRSSFGPPHASATGVYIEGLIDAYLLADILGDDDRRERYRIALIRGVRSLMQLQFVDDIDTFYISKPNSVIGGLRTTVYDNKIRVDNVQHGLMGVLKILNAFRVADYKDPAQRTP